MRIAEAETNDKNILKDKQVPKYSMLAFEKAYNFYKQFAKWTDETF